ATCGQESGWETRAWSAPLVPGTGHSTSRFLRRPLHHASLALASLNQCDLTRMRLPGGVDQGTNLRQREPGLWNPALHRERRFPRPQLRCSHRRLPAGRVLPSATMILEESDALGHLAAYRPGTGPVAGRIVSRDDRVRGESSTDSQGGIRLPCRADAGMAAEG